MPLDPMNPLEDDEDDDKPQAMGSAGPPPAGTEAVPAVPASAPEMQTTGSLAGPTATGAPAAPTAVNTPQATSVTPGGTDLSAVAQEWLANPSRFDSDLAQRGRDAITAETERGVRDATATMDERMSSRGLVGSSIEGNATADMLAQFEDDRLRRMWEVDVTAATTQAADRAQAGQFALGVQGQQGSIGLQQRALDLQAQGMSLDDAFRQAQMEQQAGQFQEGMGLERERLTGSQNLQSRALELQEQGMSMQDALARAQLEQQQGQFEAGIGLEREQLGQQDSQFQQSMEFQQAALQGSQSLQARALDLQESGMSQDEAFRRAQLDAQTSAQTRALDLQQQGMESDDAYRYSALEQDDRFRQLAADNQSRGMDIQEAYQNAELQWRQQYGERQQDLDYLQTLINLYGSSEIDDADTAAIFGASGDGTGLKDGGGGKGGGGAGEPESPDPMHEYGKRQGGEPGGKDANKTSAAAASQGDPWGFGGGLPGGVSAQVPGGSAPQMPGDPASGGLTGMGQNDDLYQQWLALQQMNAA